MQISRFSASRSFKSGRVFMNVFLFLYRVIVSLLMYTVYLVWQTCSLFSFKMTLKIMSFTKHFCDRVIAFNFLLQHHNHPKNKKDLKGTPWPSFYINLWFGFLPFFGQFYHPSSKKLLLIILGSSPMFLVNLLECWVFLCLGFSPLLWELSSVFTWLTPALLMKA